MSQRTTLIREVTQRVRRSSEVKKVKVLRGFVCVRVCLQRVCRRFGGWVCVCVCARASERFHSCAARRHIPTDAAARFVQTKATSSAAAQRASDRRLQHRVTRRNNNTPTALFIVLRRFPDRWLSHRRCNRKPGQATPWLKTCFLLTLIDGSQVTAVYLVWFCFWFFFVSSNIANIYSTWGFSCSSSTHKVQVKLNNPTVHKIFLFFLLIL